MLETALLNLTRKCNLSCKHCYISAGFPLKDELNFGQTIKSFEKLKKWGVKTLIMLGGEPFIKPKIMDLIYFASKMFKDVHIESNGMVLPVNLVEYIKREKIKNLTIFISFEDSTMEYNDNIRGEGVLEQSILTIDRLKRKGLKVAIRATLYSDNDYKGLINLAGRLGVEIIFVRFLQAGRGSELNLMPNKERLEEVYKTIKELNHVRISDCPYYIFDAELLDKTKNIFQGKGICQVLRKSRIIVDSNGDIYPCNMLIEKRYKLGNLLKDNKEKVLERYDKLIEKWKRLKTLETCKKCEYFKFCKGGCAFLSFQNRKIGDVSCPVPTLNKQGGKMSEERKTDIQC